MKNNNQKSARLIFMIIGIGFIILGGYAYFAKKDFFYLALAIMLGLFSICIGYVFSLLLEEKIPHMEEGDVNEEGL